jgi:hypothetical protein
MADHRTLGHNAITGLTLDVYYPDGVTRKFEINVLKDGTGAWTASQTGYAAVNYPAAQGDTPVAAVPPVPPTGWNVRELSYAAADYVDTNADGIYGNDNDKLVQDFLPWYGSRVTYGTDPANGNIPWTAVTATGRYQSDEALLIQVTGWIWFHQDPVIYTVIGTAARGAQSVALTNTFQFIPTLSLYLDFTSLNYGTITSGEESMVQGDTNLGTPGSPTIWDNGNVNAQVSVNATKMVKNWDGITPPDVHNAVDYNSPGKTISQFDVALYYKNGAFVNQQVGYDVFNADTQTLIVNTNSYTTPVDDMGTAGAVLLQSCRPAKIDFSVFPVSGIENGNYMGVVYISLATYAGSQVVVP